jgi:hypothetical protein
MSLEQIRDFLAASDEQEIEPAERNEIDGWRTRTLCEQGYWKQGRGVKGFLRHYLAKMTGEPLCVTVTAFYPKIADR